MCVACPPSRLRSEARTKTIWGDQPWALPMTTILRSDDAAVHITCIVIYICIYFSICD